MGCWLRRALACCLLAVVFGRGLAAEEQGEVTIPRKTIPLVPKVPRLPHKAQVALEKCCNIHVNYSYYWDPETGDTGYSTPAMLAEQESWSEAAGTMKRKTLASAIQDVIMSFIIAGAFGYLYKVRVVDERKKVAAKWPTELPHEFEIGYCACFDDCKLCCFTCCCPGLRIADTLSTLFTTLGYWQWVLVFQAMNATSTILSTLLPAEIDKSTIMGLLCVLVFVRFRLKFREELGAPEASPLTIALDAAAWCCCPPAGCCCPLAAIQEARQLDKLQGVRYVWPFTIAAMEEPKDQVPLVGPPVNVRAP